MAASLTSTDLTLDNTSGASIPGTPSAGQTVLYPKDDKLLYYKDDAGVERLVNVTAAVTPINLGTAVATTSGTSIDFTGIPAGVKRATLVCRGVSLNGTSSLLIQIGTGGSPTTSGYIATGNAYNAVNATAGVTSTAGFPIYLSNAAGIFSGSIDLFNISGNIWVSSHSGKISASCVSGGGDVSLAGLLDRVRLTTVSGTNTFDAGSVNISWEF